MFSRTAITTRPTRPFPNHRRRLRGLIFLSLLLGLATSLAAKDYLVWPDGDRLSGRHLRTRDGFIHFISEKTGEIRVPVDSVELISDSLFPRSRTSDDDPAEPQPTEASHTAADGPFPPAQPSAPPVSPPGKHPAADPGTPGFTAGTSDSIEEAVERFHAERSQEDKDHANGSEDPASPWYRSLFRREWFTWLDPWKGRILIGVDSETSPNRRFNVSLEGRGDRRTESNEIRLEAKFLQRSWSGTLSDRRWTGLVRVHHYLTTRYFLFAETEYERFRSSARETLTVQQKLGPGVKLLNGKRREARLTAGGVVFYTETTLSPSEDERFEVYPAAVFDARFSFFRSLTLSNETSLVFPGTGSLKYFLHTKTELEERFTRSLSLILRHEFRQELDRDTGPSDDYKRLRLLFSYSF